MNERIDFTDLDLVEQQTKVLVDHIAQLRKEQAHKLQKAHEGVEKSNGSVNDPIQQEQSNTTLEKPKWVSFFSKVNTLASRGSRLDFIPPVICNGTPMAKLQSEEAHKLANEWDKVVVLFVAGPKPQLFHVQRYIKAQWPQLVKPRVTAHRDGYFLVKCLNVDDVNVMLQTESLSMGGRPVIVKKWSSEFDFLRDILKAVPIWIKLYNLPLNCWGVDALSRIGSTLGLPICMDECTSSQNRVSYARLLIEVDLTQELRKEVIVERVTGVTFVQRVYYEWHPAFCKKCNQLGHSCAQQEKQKEVRKWVPRNPTTPQITQGKELDHTPDIEAPVVHSDSEHGWVAATKTARQQVASSQNTAQRSSFSLFQHRDEEELSTLLI